MLTFIEATLFTKRIIELGAEETYRALQNELAANPDAGDVIAGMGGLRKIRLSLPGRGKRGAARTLYLLFTRAETIVFLLNLASNLRWRVRASRRLRPATGSPSDKPC